MVMIFVGGVVRILDGFPVLFLTKIWCETLLLGNGLRLFVEGTNWGISMVGKKFKITELSVRKLQTKQKAFVDQL